MRPRGGGGEPCNPEPCTLANAVNNAKGGDQVVVTPGHYAPGSKVDLDHAIDVDRVVEVDFEPGA